MQAPPLPARPQKKTQRPVPPVPTNNAGPPEENGPSLPFRENRGSSTEFLSKPVQRRSTEDVERLISKAPSVPSTMPELFATEEPEEEKVEGAAMAFSELRRGDERTTDAQALGKPTKPMAPQKPARNGLSSTSNGDKVAEALSYEQVHTDEPPPPYNMDYLGSVSYPTADLDSMEKEKPIEPEIINPSVASQSAVPSAPTTPSIEITPSALPLIADQAATASPIGQHRRCYSDCSDTFTTHNQTPIATSETSIDNLQPRTAKGWRQALATTRTAASDVEFSSDDDHLQVHIRSPSAQSLGTKVAQDDGGLPNNNNNEPGPPPGNNNGPDSNPPPTSQPLPQNISYPHLTDLPHAGNPLLPSPVSCEIREEWEPGMDPMFSSRSKLSNLFTSKSSESSWRRACIELVPEDGWKLAVYDVVKSRGRDGEGVYQKKLSTAPFQIYSLRHAVVTPPRTGYGSARSEILCIRLVSGKYVVLSMPDARIRGDWSKGVKAAAEMATRSPLATKGVGMRPK